MTDDVVLIVPPTRIKVTGPVEVQVEQSQEKEKKKKQRKPRKSILEKLISPDAVDQQEEKKKKGVYIVCVL